MSSNLYECSSGNCSRNSVGEICCTRNLLEILYEKAVGDTGEKSEKLYEYSTSLSRGGEQTEAV